MSQSMLVVDNLNVTFENDSVHRQVVRGVDFHVNEGEILGIVGESGSGKSVTSLAVMRLLDPNATVSGRIEFAGRDLSQIDDRAFNAIRGGEIAMIFQDALGAFNPVQTIGKQLREALTLETGTESLRRTDRKRIEDEAIPPAQGSRHRRPGKPSEGISASIVRRHESKSLDRHDAGARAETAHRR